LIGLFLLIALIKRIRDKRATQELKVALSTSTEPSTNTAAAFSVDGSMLPTASTVDDTPIEEDSVEAGVKIDMAKAYLDLDDIEAAQELLQEAIVEGSNAQRATAEKLLRKTT
jgi:pilus assembly protein FimV